eukprot:CAMPEP_0116897514 /NCGR_PEP_ID=MMETSP0467-20121206/6467_1 /TAXON_ID=283647 /ORGANISM="Mesodinium pulex, Strain SPMC105" /LENGTH=191 /DNA_ID=CAMNT_0004569179 /DNA_START=1445 /DNA_END=2020 /DNA_ORIENTATION=+
MKKKRNQQEGDVDFMFEVGSKPSDTTSASANTTTAEHHVVKDSVPIRSGKRRGSERNQESSGVFGFGYGQSNLDNQTPNTNKESEQQQQRKEENELQAFKDKVSNQLLPNNNVKYVNPKRVAKSKSRSRSRSNSVNKSPVRKARLNQMHGNLNNLNNVNDNNSERKRICSNETPINQNHDKNKYNVIEKDI